MQILPKDITQHNTDTVTLTTGSDYVKLFSIPCRTACNFNLSGQISNRDWAISGTFTAGWNEAGITGTLSQIGKGTNGVYALRALQASNGTDVDLWLVFNGNVSGTMTLGITVTPANVQGDITFHDLVRTTTMPGTQRGSIEYHTADAYNVWGTSGTKM